MCLTHDIVPIPTATSTFAQLRGSQSRNRHSDMGFQTVNVQLAGMEFPVLKMDDVGRGISGVRTRIDQGFSLDRTALRP